MRAFSCPSCGQLVFFHNSECLRCRSPLAFDPDAMRIVVPDAQDQRCANASLATCNWLLRDHDAHHLCRSCRLTRTRPDDDDPDALAAFAEAEQQKRRVVFQLLDLGLPVQPFDADSGDGVAFDLLSSRVEQVMTGHDGGIITLDLAESDDVHREQVRQQMGEAYRTVLGHLRHEVGHYYWNVMVAPAPRNLARFRVLFGDERADYAESLERHYSSGPPPDWDQRHVSQYATMHPWEDWAETFAHYLHLRDSLQTAASFGLQVVGPDIDTPDPADELTAAPSEPADDDPIAELVADWLALSYALNAMSRSLGNDDLYPFVLAPAVVAKLSFVHRLVAGLDPAPVQT